MIPFLVLQKEEVFYYIRFKIPAKEIIKEKLESIRFELFVNRLLHCHHYLHSRRYCRH